MAAEMWVTVKTKYCDLIGIDVALEEKRAFPAGCDHEMGCYLVLDRRCTAAVTCNLAGIQCRWAFTNPELDRFELAC